MVRLRAHRQARQRTLRLLTDRTCNDLGISSAGRWGLLCGSHCWIGLSVIRRVRFENVGEETRLELG